MGEDWLGEKLTLLTSEDENLEARCHSMRQLCEHFFGRKVETQSWDGKAVVAQASESAASLVPLTEENTRECVSIIQKTALYSGFTIFLRPGSTAQTRVDEYGGGNEYDGFTCNEDTQRLLNLNEYYADVVTKGQCAFMPERMIYEQRQLYFTVDENITATPLIGPLNDNFLPLTAQPVKPGTRDYFTYKDIVLPYFPEASLIDIARIAQEETDAFVLFNRFLRDRLRKVAEADSKLTFDEVMEEIDDGVARLNLEAQRLSKSKAFRNSTIALAPISLGVAVFAPGVVTSAIAGVIGTYKVLDLLKEHFSVEKEVLMIKKSEFYIPYVLRSLGDAEKKAVRRGFK